MMHNNLRTAYGFEGYGRPMNPGQDSSFTSSFNVGSKERYVEAFDSSYDGSRDFRLQQWPHSPVMGESLPQYTLGHNSVLHSSSEEPHQHGYSEVEAPLMSDYYAPSGEFSTGCLGVEHDRQYDYQSDSVDNEVSPRYSDPQCMPRGQSHLDHHDVRSEFSQIVYNNRMENYDYESRGQPHIDHQSVRNESGHFAFNNRMENYDYNPGSNLDSGHISEQNNSSNFYNNEAHNHDSGGATHPPWGEEQISDLSAAYASGTPHTPTYSPYPPAYFPYAPAYLPYAPAYSPYVPAYSPYAHSPCAPAYFPSYSPYAPAHSPCAPAYFPSNEPSNMFPQAYATVNSGSQLCLPNNPNPGAWCSDGFSQFASNNRMESYDYSPGSNFDSGLYINEPNNSSNFCNKEAHHHDKGGETQPPSGEEPRTNASAAYGTENSYSSAYLPSYEASNTFRQANATVSSGSQLCLPNNPNSGAWCSDEFSQFAYNSRKENYDYSPGSNLDSGLYINEQNSSSNFIYNQDHNHDKGGDTLPPWGEDTRIKFSAAYGTDDSCAPAYSPSYEAFTMFPQANATVNSGSQLHLPNNSNPGARCSHKTHCLGSSVAPQCSKLCVPRFTSNTLGKRKVPPHSVPQEPMPNMSSLILEIKDLLNKIRLGIEENMDTPIAKGDCSHQMPPNNISYENSEYIGTNHNMEKGFHDALAFGVEQTEAEEEALSEGLTTIRNDDLEVIRELGSGAFGTVYHARWKCLDVAIKRLKARCFAGGPSERDYLIAQFWKEATILSSLRHPKILQFYGIVHDGPGRSLAIVTEFMADGSLKQFMRKQDRPIDHRKRLIIANDIAFGMAYLHGKNIVHFDLKCENLLVDMRNSHQPICKIGDLGLSKVKEYTLVSGGLCGTLPWMAPELLSGEVKVVSGKVDVYSFGIVMWELLTGKEPYANMHHAHIIGRVLNGSLRPQVPSGCDSRWKSLMTSCWASDPEERPSFNEIAMKLKEMAWACGVKYYQPLWA